MAEPLPSDPLRCFLVDDNEVFLELATTLLRRQQIAVVGVASCGDEALGSHAQLAPEVTLVDVELGSECGFELAGRLSRRGATVIMMSAHAEEDVADAVSGSGAVGFIPKAVLSAAAIRELLAR